MGYPSDETIREAHGWNQKPIIDFEVENLLLKIKNELKSARTKFPGDRVTMIALVEEVGELAKALMDEPSSNIEKEAIQVAVMAIRVALDGDSSVRDLRKSKGLDNHPIPF
jgi:NTP pyrophosphatase (non-canonical NTP hydrolase)